MYMLMVVALMFVLPIASIAVGLVRGDHAALNAAIAAAAVFYGLAGVNHCMHRHRNRLENLAMASDLFVAVVLAITIGERTP